MAVVQLGGPSAVFYSPSALALVGMDERQQTRPLFTLNVHSTHGY